MDKIATYQDYGHAIKRLPDEAWIPKDETNTDYQQYLAWVAEGNTAEEWQPDGE